MTIQDRPEAANAGHSAPLVHGVAPSPVRAVSGAPEPLGEQSPYFSRVWRGSPVYACPECGSPHTSHGGVERHIAAAHPSPEPDTASVAERAERAGIILATR